jgi:hypothetical protein
MLVSNLVLIWGDSALPSVSLPRTRKKEWQDLWRKESRNLTANRRLSPMICVTIQQNY